MRLLLVFASLAAARALAGTPYLRGYGGDDFSGRERALEEVTLLSDEEAAVVQAKEAAARAAAAADAAAALAKAEEMMAAAKEAQAKAEAEAAKATEAKEATAVATAEAPPAPAEEAEPEKAEPESEAEPEADEPQAQPEAPEEPAEPAEPAAEREATEESPAELAAEAEGLVAKLKAELAEESELLQALSGKLQQLTGEGDAPVGKNLHVATWNMAAINNNPFEYWITHDDAAYNQLMKDVQAFVSEPGEKDVKVYHVFTDTMWAELKEAMGKVGWAGLDAVDDLWNDDFRGRRIVSGFLKDGALGKKRLASMPDRVTNTIRAVDADGAPQQLFRPTVINCYPKEDLGTLDEWWAAWKAFLFDTKVQSSKDAEPKPVYDLLLPIKRSKYPALTEAEEKVSIPLQTLAGAIFDAILVHMMAELHPGWQGLRKELCGALNARKDARTAEILEQSYGSADVLFLQEAASTFVAEAKAGPLGAKYHVLAPAAMDPKRDQNSLVLLSKARFPTPEAREFTDAVLAGLADAPVAPGDLLAVAAADANETPYVFASFHGDTNGLATIPVTDALLETLGKEGLESSKLVFGLDANTYAAKRDGYQEAAAYQAHVSEKGLASQRGAGAELDPKVYTTFNARTYLQPQLNKAVAFDDRFSDPNVDRNPKDFLLFKAADFSLGSTGRDNTGARAYANDIMFPTLTFPSDHAVTRATLNPA